MPKLGPFFELILIAATGAAIAMGIDSTISMDGSLLNSANQYLDIAAKKLNTVRVPFYLVASILVLFGSLSVCYLRPMTRKGAFTCGFASIAMLAIFIP